MKNLFKILIPFLLLSVCSGKEYIEYFENGNIKVKGQYRGGLMIGEWIYYSNDGSIEKKDVWKNNILYFEGLSDSLLESSSGDPQQGDIAFNIVGYYKEVDDKKELVKKIKYLSRNPSFVLGETNYKNGKKHGVEIKYDPSYEYKQSFGSGKGMYPGWNFSNFYVQNYKDGKLEGESFSSSLGYGMSVTLEVNYKNGEKDGKQIEKFEYCAHHMDCDEKGIRSEGYFKNGKKDGKWTYYFSPDVSQFKEVYKDGELIDVLQSESIYKDGELIKVLYYDSNNNLIEDWIETWEHIR